MQLFNTVAHKTSSECQAQNASRTYTCTDWYIMNIGQHLKSPPRNTTDKLLNNSQEQTPPKNNTSHASEKQLNNQGGDSCQQHQHLAWDSQSTPMWESFPYYVLYLKGSRQYHTLRLLILLIGTYQNCDCVFFMENAKLVWLCGKNGKFYEKWQVGCEKNKEKSKKNPLPVSREKSGKPCSPEALEAGERGARRANKRLSP